MTVRAVPEGFTTITPFLNIKGAMDAIELYEQAFGARKRRLFEAPSGVVINAELQIGNAMLRISDAVNDPPTQSNLQLYVEDADAAWQRAVAAGLEVVMPLQAMYWGDKIGVVKDRFGNRWAISQHVEDVPGDEIVRRAAVAAIEP